MRKLSPCLSVLVLNVAISLPATAVDLTTRAERTGFLETGRYTETVELCEAFARQWPETVRCFDFGTTPEGRPMKAMAISRSGALTAAEARKRNIPVTLIQGGIHAGEIDGKDAGFWLLKDILQEKSAPGAALDKQVWLFVPVFNVDGHERFQAWSRPNQRGPKESGFRATVQGFNLNRDYMKADAPEMQAMLQLVEEWDPLVEVDLHVTNGSKFEHDVSITGEPVTIGDEQLKRTGQAFKQKIIDDLAAQGSLPLPFYPSLFEYDNPASGFADEVYPPRFSHGYFPLRNRFAILVETHSWKEYPVRVRITRNTIVSILDQVAEHGQDWLAQVREADVRAAKIGGQDVPLAYTATDKSHLIDFRGYAWTRRPSEISGALMTEYDESTPQIWKVPLRDELVPSISAVAPLGGYVVPAAFAAQVAAKLQVHGIDFQRIGAQAAAPVQTFRVEDVTLSASAMESRQRASVKGQWQAEPREIPAGSLFVPIAQARSRLLMSLLEPLAPDSLLQWGEFNNIFERKEYMDAYVTETEARKMLAASPALKAEFEEKLKDEKFAANPRARLDFFYQRHPAWDERFRLYPVLRSDAVLK